MLNGIERRLFIAATGQNDGKTTTTVGVLTGYRGVARSVGFIKPVGQRYVLVEGQTIDKDSVLIHNVFHIACPLKDMSPVAIERNFTRNYLDAPGEMLPRLEAEIRRAFASVARDNDFVVIEGTGHAGVGSVIDLNNARVARMLNAKVVIVTCGGIGRPVDEVALNQTLFTREGVEVIGVIANKIQADKLEQTRDYLTRAFARRGLPLLGAIPFTPRLTWPTIEQITAATGATVLSGRANLHHEVAQTVICAMTPHNAVKYIQDKTLLLIPGDRDDLVFAAITTALLRKDVTISGIILTGGLQLAAPTRELLMRTDIPLLAMDRPTYEAATELHDITIKIQEGDREKVRLAGTLVAAHVDLERIWKML